MNAIYLVLYFWSGLGGPTPSSDTVNAAETSSVTGDTFKSPF
jgi:hypothetical protein